MNSLMVRSVIYSHVCFNFIPSLFSISKLLLMWILWYLQFKENTFIETVHVLKSVFIDGHEQTVSNYEKVVKIAGELKLNHILRTLYTGAKAVSAGGWTKRPQILFDHDGQSSYVRTSTCAVTVTVPVTEANKVLRSFIFSLCSSLSHVHTFSTVSVLTRYQIIW